jgi:hypothetical protein
MTSDWRTSSYTGGQGNCVEVANTTDIIIVRDTKDRAGAVLCVSAAAWQVFTNAFKLSQNQ